MPTSVFLLVFVQTPSELIEGSKSPEKKIKKPKTSVPLQLTKLAQCVRHAGSRDSRAAKLGRFRETATGLHQQGKLIQDNYNANAKCFDETALTIYLDFLIKH